jgi:TetR/AcrR family transcriptional regulator, transcriptional repressor of bet genes
MDFQGAGQPLRERRSFHHESVEVRRQDLLDATLDAVAELGLRGATVREIATRAGVTPGLIRHYFQSKDLMFQEAYREVVNTMFETALSAAVENGQDARGRLREYIVACFQSPIIDPRNLTLWATFVSQISVDPALAAIHWERYLACRDRLEAYIAEILIQAHREPVAGEARSLSIAVNGIIDGLWLEATMAARLFEEGELCQIALSSVERIIGLPLES